MPQRIDLVSGIKIRWITTNCFEIVLPNGKVILTDPYITGSPNKNFSVSEVMGADYMLISHIHFDHVNDVKEIAKKFKSQVFVGDLSAVELCKLCDLPAERICLMRGGEKFEFEDCTLEAISTRHVVLPPDGTRFANHPELALLNKKLKRPPAEEIPYWYGCLEQLNYLVTAKDGTTILLWGGQATEDQCNKLRGLKPTIAIIQATGNLPAKISKLVGAIGPQIAIPHHHDFLEILVEFGLDIPGGLNAAVLINELAACIAADAPDTKFLELKRNSWYEIGTAVKTMD
ncbi:MAG TPA: MBL fold metallo-hydrolase [Patescibacteria group bacterium]|nr:MBL fold metallo-hydrolase [Patescibacteria group bacterium]